MRKAGVDRHGTGPGTDIARDKTEEATVQHVNTHPCSRLPLPTCICAHGSSVCA